MKLPPAPAVITVEDLPGGVVPSGYVLLDVREDDEWDAGHAPSSLHIPMSELPSRLEDLPDEEVIVICRSGGRSHTCAQWLNLNGFDALELAGGLLHWQAVGYPVVRPDGQVGAEII